MKKLLSLCIIAIVLVSVSCTTTSTATATQIANKAANSLTKINTLLSIIPANCGIQSVDNLKTSTVSSLRDITGLINTTTTLYNKVSNPSTRSTVSLTEIATAVQNIQSTRSSLNSLKSSWNTITNNVKNMDKAQIAAAAKSLSYINNAIDTAQTVLNGDLATLNSLVSLLQGI